MQLTADMKKDIKEVLKEHGIKKAGIYGSYARGEADRSESDIDLIVKLSRNDLLELVSLKNDLEDRLNLEVDIITYDGLRDFARKEDFKERVLQDEEKIL